MERGVVRDGRGGISGRPRGFGSSLAGVGRVGLSRHAALRGAAGATTRRRHQSTAAAFGALRAVIRDGQDRPSIHAYTHTRVFGPFIWSIGGFIWSIGGFIWSIGPFIWCIGPFIEDDPGRGALVRRGVARGVDSVGLGIRAPRGNRRHRQPGDVGDPLPRRRRRGFVRGRGGGHGPRAHPGVHTLTPASTLTLDRPLTHLVHWSILLVHSLVHWSIGPSIWSIHWSIGPSIWSIYWSIGPLVHSIDSPIGPLVHPFGPLIGPLVHSFGSLIGPFGPFI